MARITIGIEENVWRSLIQLKLDLKLRTFDDVITHLINNQKRLSSATSEPYNKPKLQNSNKKLGGKKQ